MKLNCKPCGKFQHFEPRMIRLKRPRILRYRDINSGDEKTIQIDEVQKFFCPVCGTVKY